MNKKYPLDIQLFTEGDPAGSTPPAAGAGNTTPPEPAGEQPVQLTQAQLDKLISGKIAEERKRAEDKANKAAELAKLSEEEKAKKLLEDKDLELQGKEALLTRRELKLQAIDILDEQKLPVKCADFLIGDSADATLANIKSFGEAFNQAVQVAVEERLKGSGFTPGSGSGNQLDGVEAAFYKLNPDLKK